MTRTKRFSFKNQKNATLRNFYGYAATSTFHLVEKVMVMFGKKVEITNFPNFGDAAQNLPKTV